MASRPRESSRARELPDGVGAGTAQPGPALRRPWEGGGGTGDPRRLARAWRAWGVGGRRPEAPPGMRVGVAGARLCPPGGWRRGLEICGCWAPPASPGGTLVNLRR